MWAMTAAPLRLVVADDHPVVRSGLRRILETEGWDVVAEAGDVDQVRRMVLGHKPDVLLLDLNMQGESSLDAIADLLERSPDTRIVILTMQAEPAYARDSLRAGASGYVLKESAEEELVTAVRAAAEGRRYVHPRIGGMLATLDDVRSQDDLTPREREVLHLLALGHTNAEIAEQLFLSRRTVETHRANVQRKLDLTTRADLTHYALENGLLTA